MVQKFYADKNGKYLGSYDGPAGPDNPHEGETETDSSPNSPTDVWDSSMWITAAIDPEVQLSKDLKLIDLSDDIENIMDAMLVYSIPMFDSIAKDTLDKYRMKKTIRNQ